MISTQDHNTNARLVFPGVSKKLSGKTGARVIMTHTDLVDSECITLTVINQTTTIQTFCLFVSTAMGNSTLKSTGKIMQFIHVKNLEKYHPGYKDRTLQWAKVYINMVQGDPETELLNEIDWSRLIRIILLELRAQRPLPDNDTYWSKNGFDVKKRSMSLTIQMLHNFLDVVTEDSKLRHVDKSRVDKDKENLPLHKTPTLLETTDYLRTLGIEGDRSSDFFDYYQSNGWKVGGRAPMKDWQAAARRWARNTPKEQTNGRIGSKPFPKDHQ